MAKRYEHSIPEGYEARIEGDKVIIELKESEDERIELLNYLYDVHDDDEERARWIFYLEKQGEHADFRNKIQIGDRVTRNKDGVLVNLSQLKRVAKKQGEQKPAEWSEEDEDIIEWLIGYLEYQIMNATIIEEKNNCLNAISMLKSLKDRMLSKQEWSEEDKDIIEAIEALCDDKIRFTEFQDVKEHAYTVKNWLKSLKDRYTWKPSKEMLEALYRAVPKNVKEMSEDEMLLDKLYQGLKYGRVLSEN